MEFMGKDIKKNNETKAKKIMNACHRVGNDGAVSSKKSLHRSILFPNFAKLQLGMPNFKDWATLKFLIRFEYDQDTNAIRNSKGS